jgi:hypothetical protein
VLDAVFEVEGLTLLLIVEERVAVRVPVSVPLTVPLPETD